MNDVGIFSLDDLLAEDSHVHLVEAHPDLFGGEEGPLVELAGPHLLDGLPRLWEAALGDSKLD